MSRANYSDGDDNPDYPLALWRGAVQSAIRGRRGQAFLKELLAALDAMPIKRLIVDDLIRDGEVCALGAVGVSRGMAMGHLDPHAEAEPIAEAFGIAPCMVREIEFENDEGAYYSETPEQRFDRVRRWVISEIIGYQANPGGQPK